MRRFWIAFGLAPLTALLGACTQSHDPRAVAAPSEFSQSAAAANYHTQAPPAPADAPGAPTLGHWESATTPDGRQTSVWVPIDSYQVPHAAGQQSGYQPFNAPNLNQPYVAARGRYDTVRSADGRLEYEWNAQEPSNPQQGYFQATNSGRVWVSGMIGTASER